MMLCEFIVHFGNLGASATRKCDDLSSHSPSCIFGARGEVFVTVDERRYSLAANQGMVPIGNLQGGDSQRGTQL
jgi:hypothetical protein